MKDKLYAIIDVETTGGRASRDRITEIAIVLHDGKQIVDRWESLINPERAIPYNITQITGITQEMVVNAPRFYEVAKKIVELTKGAIFVAHNVRFDYSFIKEEFKRLGYTFTRRQLCTVRLARKAFPGLRSYSLGKLIKHFGIKVKQRHRAMADTMATTTLLEMILDKENSEDKINELVNLGVRQSQLPVTITLETLHALPEECGVYYFYNKSGDIIYVGKSINIKKRVMEHFAKQTEKARKLYKSVHDISFEVTGSELVALLFESHEIKTHHPKINRAQRARAFPYVIFSYYNEEGYLCLKTGRVTAKEKKELNILREYPKLTSVKGALNRILEEFELCQTHCSVDYQANPCFYYHIQKCSGACIGKESPEDYNQRVQKAIDQLDIDFRDNFILLDRGRTPEERSV
ncbi:MAG: exonuclease domain-containing protein, partial [Bacteroidota bacterium]